MQEIIKKRNELLAQKMILSFKKRHFNAFYCATKEQVVQKICELISKDETIAWGGSVTVDELGLKKYLSENGYKLINRDAAKTKEEKRDLVLKGLGADVFLMSSNAITEDGELVNIDGHGTRIVALCYGPKKVIVIAGMNKVVKTLDDAISRARNFAAPVNAKRCSNFFDINTPCLTAGTCMDCKSETSICSQILTTRLSYPKGRINVILVNEDLGF